MVWWRMAVVKVFKCEGGRKKRDDIITILSRSGIKVYRNYSPADISIVLDGRYENPIVLDGKKILITDELLWNKTWAMFMAILPQYYDEIITDYSIDTVRRVIEDEIKKP